MLRYLTVTIVLSFSSLAPITLQEGKDSSTHNFSLDNRRIRSAQIIGNVVFTGLRAVRDLLANSKMIATFGAHRQFVKEGGFKEALNDFYSVDPTYVQVFAKQGEHHGNIGRVGDRELVLRYDEVQKWTTLDIIKRHPEHGLLNLRRDKDIIPTDRIIYVDTNDIN